MYVQLYTVMYMYIVLTCLLKLAPCLVINWLPLMRGHLQCRDTLAGNEGCPLKTGTTVPDLKFKVRFY